MQTFLANVFPGLPGEVHAEVEKEVKQLVRRVRQQLLGEIQMMLANYNLELQEDLELLRKEIDRIFLEGDEP